MTTTMRKYRTFTEACRDAKEYVQESIDAGQYNEAFVLRRDGDTEVFANRGRRTPTRHRRAGHITCGMVVNKDDLPCVVFRRS